MRSHIVSWLFEAGKELISFEAGSRPSLDLLHLKPFQKEYVPLPQRKLNSLTATFPYRPLYSLHPDYERGDTVALLALLTCRQTPSFDEPKVLMKGKESQLPLHRLRLSTCTAGEHQCDYNDLVEVSIITYSFRGSSDSVLWPVAAAHVADGSRSVMLRPYCCRHHSSRVSATTGTWREHPDISSTPRQLAV